VLTGMRDKGNGKGKEASTRKGCEDTVDGKGMT